MSDDITRRDVLRGLGGLAFAGALGCDSPSDIEVVKSAVGTCAATVIPAVANAIFPVPTVQGYAQKSVAAGDHVDFRISSNVDYQLSIVRLGWDVETPGRDWVLKTFPTSAAAQRTVAPGSYVHVERALGSTQSFPQLTLECWVRTFRTGGVGLAQGIISQYSFPYACGVVLFLDANNVPFFYLGDGGYFNGNYLWEEAGGAITANDVHGPAWHHLALVFNSGTATLYVDGNVYVTKTGLPSAVMAGSAPLRLGAAADTAGTRYFLDGDIAMPVIYSAALTPAQVQARYAQVTPNNPPGLPSDPSVIGCWPLTEEGDVVVGDVSGCARPGVIVNRGTWMVGGPGFDATTVPRVGIDPMTGNPTYYPYNNPYNPDAPATMAARGHGLRLSTTDLYDCGWPVSLSGTLPLSYTIPNDCPPGLYVGRIRSASDSSRLYDITFVVRRAASRPVAPIVVLSASNTWHAYNSSVNALAAPSGDYERVRFYEDSGIAGNPVYHRQPNYFQGFEMPWSDPLSGGADPYMTYPDYNSTDGQDWRHPSNNPPYIPGYGHLVRPERYLHIWLERNGYDYDVVSDKDLHFDPNLLSQYRVLIITGHSEYWTKEAYDNVKNYIAAGGKVLVASGNTMFWRVSYDASTIECRKAPTTVGGFANASWWDLIEYPKWGELYHQTDHLRGGLMRDAGFPAWGVVGLESSGYTDPFGQYTVVNLATLPAASLALFQTPEVVSAPNGVIGGASSVGHEWDVRLSSLTGTLPFTPPYTYSPTPLAQANLNSGRFDYQTTWNYDSPFPVVSEIIDWPQDGGGRVFNVGSIAAAQALQSDASLAALFRNVLFQDGVTINVNALMIGTNGHFRQKYYDGTNWLATLDDNGGAFGTTPPTGVQWGPNARSAMAIDANGAFQYTYNLGAGWAAWTNFGSGFTGRPAAVGWGRNRIDLFARSTGNRLMQKGWDGVNWSSWNDLGAITSDPSAVNWQGNRLGVAALNSGSVFYWSRSSTDPAGWASSNLGSSYSHAPTLLVWGGNRINLFAVSGAGRCYYKYFDGSTWTTGWQDLGFQPGVLMIGLSGRVSAAVAGPDKILLVGLGPNGRLRHKLWDGSTLLWQPSQLGWFDTLGGTFVGEPAVASYRGGYVSVVAVDTAGNLKHNLWNGSAFTGWTTLVAGGVRRSPALFQHILS